MAGTASEQIAAALGLANNDEPFAVLIRRIERLVAERDTFRDALDKAFVPLIKRARKLQVEDYLQNDNGDLWTVTRIEPDAFGVTVDLRSCRTGREVHGKRIDGLDTPITVLTPSIARDGLLLLRKELGAQLVDYERPERPAG